MNIWLDTTQFPHNFTGALDSHYLSQGMEDNNDCPNDKSIRDYTFSHPDIPVAPVISEEHLVFLYTHTFVCPETLYIQPCTDSLWLICNPVDAGTVIVIDTELYALLMRFRTPQTLQDAFGDETIIHAHILRAVKLFIYSGMLQVFDQSVSPVLRRSDQTLATWLHLTNACNLHCEYCYVRKNAEHMAKDTSMRAVDAIIRSAMYYRHRNINLTYAGGESTLRLPQLFSTHDYALQQTSDHDLNLSASMISNGTIMPLWAIEQLKLRQINVGISLDGIGESHDRQRPMLNGKGSFAAVDRTITRMLAGGLIPSINVTVTQRNLDELPQLLEYILQRDLPFGLSYYRDNECSTHLSDLQFTDEHMIHGMRAAFTYIEQHLPQRPLLGLLVDKANTRAPHQHTCGVGRNYLAINQRGGIAKCHADITDTVTTIYADNPLQALREDRRGVQAVAVDEKEGCSACEWRYWCSGGCPMLTYRLTGRSDIKSPNCAIYKALFPEALRLEALRLLKYTSPIVI